MTQQPSKILIVRPQPAAGRTAKATQEAGFDAVTLPLFSLAKLSWDIPDTNGFDGLLITSANALDHGGEAIGRLTSLPLLAVGDATAKAAERLGFQVALIGNSDKAGLLQQAKAEGFQRLLWLGGKHRTGATANESIIAKRITVYESAEVAPPIDFEEQVGACKVALLFSPRAARYFANLFDRSRLDRSRFSILALSPAIAEAAGQGWASIGTAEEPREDLLLQMAQGMIT